MHPPFEVRIHHPCGRVLARRGWTRSRENSLALRDHELWLVWHGEGWMADETSRFELRPGFCVWMRPGGIYDAGLNPGQSLGFTYVHFGCSWPSPPEFFHLHKVSFFDSATRHLVERVGPAPVSAWGSPVEGVEGANALLRAVLIDLLDERGRPGPVSPHGGLIETLAGAMRDRPEERHEVAAMARRAGTTASHFSRLFRGELGLSPKQFHLRARLDRARHLLAESDLSVTEVAEVLGYRDVFFFSRQFKRHMGRSPVAYRGEHRSAGGSRSA